MKHVKKIMALVMAMVMVLGMSSMTALAEGTQKYSITVKDGYKGETYTAYKIFDVVYNASDNYAYTISKDGEWFDDIVGETLADAKGDYTLTAYGIKFQKTTTDGIYNVVNAVDGTNPSKDNMASLAAELEDKTDGKTNAGTGSVAKVVGDGYGAKADVVINVTPDEAGYYFVTTTTGSLCALNTTNPNVEVEEKNDLPTVEKKQSDNASNYADSNIDLSIGDTVYYQITVTDGKGTDSDITLTDTMTDGLTYKGGSIKIDGTPVADDYDDEDYEISVSGQTIIITIKAKKVAALAEDATVVITYEATVNDSAVTKSEEDTDSSNKNTVVLEYSEQSTQDSVEVNTFKFQLVKDNTSKEILTGAKFQLYDSENATTPIGLIKDDVTNTYRPLKAGETTATVGYTTEIEAGKPVFRGFKNGTYWFEETNAPVGYNILTKRESIIIDEADNMSSFEENGNYKAGGIEIVNKSGTLLPSTGGMGTKLFYLVGGILVVIAGVLLVSRKRMEREN